MMYKSVIVYVLYQTFFQYIYILSWIHVYNICLWVIFVEGMFCLGWVFIFDYFDMWSLFDFLNMGVSKNMGTPKWMVDNGKPYWNPIFGNIYICFTFPNDDTWKRLTNSLKTQRNSSELVKPQWTRDLRNGWGFPPKRLWFVYIPKTQLRWYIYHTYPQDPCMVYNTRLPLKKKTTNQNVGKYTSFRWIRHGIWPYVYGKCRKTISYMEAMKLFHQCFLSGTNVAAWTLSSCSSSSSCSSDSSLQSQSSSGSCWRTSVKLTANPFWNFFLCSLPFLWLVQGSFFLPSFVFCLVPKLSALEVVTFHSTLHLVFFSAAAACSITAKQAHKQNKLTTKQASHKQASRNRTCSKVEQKYIQFYYRSPL